MATVLVLPGRQCFEFVLQSLPVQVFVESLHLWL